jgi:broad specificity phosphatase PhoE
VKVYVVRHGECVTNKTHCFGGWTQTPLTEQGRKDALRAGKILDGIHFDAVYSSDLYRAIETCHLALPGTEPILRESLRELSVGDFHDRPVDECLKEYGDVCVRARKTRDYRAVGGECHEEQLQRVSGFVRELEQLSGCGNVAVFCHEGTVKCFLSCILWLPVNPFALQVNNGSVSVFEYLHKSWRLDQWNI